MSCIDCDIFTDGDKQILYRWKNANVMINGCKKHVLEIFEVLNKAQEPKLNKEGDKE